MARLQMIQIEGVDELQSEDAALSASPIACAVADAWVTQRRDYHGLTCCEGSIALAYALDALEAATRESPLRKVRP